MIWICFENKWKYINIEGIIFGGGWRKKQQVVNVKEISDVRKEENKNMEYSLK